MEFCSIGAWGTEPKSPWPGPGPKQKTPVRAGRGQNKHGTGNRIIIRLWAVSSCVNTPYQTCVLYLVERFSFPQQSWRHDEPLCPFCGVALLWFWSGIFYFSLPCVRYKIEFWNLTRLSRANVRSFQHQHLRRIHQHCEPNFQSPLSSTIQQRVLCRQRVRLP